MPEFRECFEEYERMLKKARQLSKLSKWLPMTILFAGIAFLGLVRNSVELDQIAIRVVICGIVALWLGSHALLLSNRVWKIIPKYEVGLLARAWTDAEMREFALIRVKYLNHEICIIPGAGFVKELYDRMSNGLKSEFFKEIQISDRKWIQIESEHNSTPSQTRWDIGKLGELEQALQKAIQERKLIRFSGIAGMVGSVPVAIAFADFKYSTLVLIGYLLPWAAIICVNANRPNEAKVAATDMAIIQSELDAEACSRVIRSRVPYVIQGVASLTGVPLVRSLFSRLTESSAQEIFAENDEAGKYLLCGGLLENRGKR